MYITIGIIYASLIAAILIFCLLRNLVLYVMLWVNDNTNDFKSWPRWDSYGGCVYFGSLEVHEGWVIAFFVLGIVGMLLWPVHLALYGTVGALTAIRFKRRIEKKLAEKLAELKQKEEGK